jgi:hypothetical protein
MTKKMLDSLEKEKNKTYREEEDLGEGTRNTSYRWVTLDREFSLLHSFPSLCFFVFTLRPLSYPTKKAKSLSLAPPLISICFCSVLFVYFEKKTPKYSTPVSLHVCLSLCLIYMLPSPL